MKRPSENVFDNSHITKDAHKFFILRWYEIFDEYTFDSWQVRSSNLITILDEILVSCEIVEKIHAHHPNIKSLIDEAKRAVRNDLIIKAHFPFVRHYIDDLETIYTKNTKNKEDLDAKALTRSVRVIQGNLQDYRKYLFEDILSVIKNPPSKYKKELYSLTLSLGIELLAVGYSLGELRNSLNYLLSDENVDFADKFEGFLDQYSGKHIECTLLFHLSLPKPMDTVDQLHGHDISFSKERPPEEGWTDEERIFYTKDKQTVIATLKVKAVDMYSAKTECEQRIEALFTALKLYQATKIPAIKHKGTLVKREGKQAKYLETDNSRTRYIRDSKSPISNTNSFSKVLRGLNSDGSAQLLSSLQYHKLALSATTDEAKLVNLWIGLEALLQSGEGSNIKKVISYIPQTNSLDYISQLTKFLPISMKDIWRSKDTSCLRGYLSYSNQYMLHQKDILLIFLSDPDGEIVKEFCKLLSEDPLHLFRVERIYSEYFVKPKKLYDVIKKHNQNIEWQLTRIYRVRNRIMHQAGQALQLRQLIQHLHSYYITTVHALIRDIKQNPMWSIADALEHRKKLYEHYLSQLENYGKTPFCSDALLKPSHILNNCSDEPAWEGKIE